MSNERTENGVGSSGNTKQRFGQFPVDALVGKVGFEAIGGRDFLRIIVMNEHSAPQFMPFNEYLYNDTAVSIEDVNSFTMRCGSIERPDKDIGEFVGPMSQQLSIPQAAIWRCGVHSPQSARKRLYKGVDPDDDTKMIGVLIEQDAQGNLAQVTWYKTRNAKTLFRKSPPALDFELVRGADGEPSTDPNDIGGWTWYYATSLYPCM